MLTFSKIAQAPTWHGEIKNYFTALDISKMRSIRGYDLSSYSFVVSHAPDIYQRVSLPPDAKGRMPMDPGSPWSKEMISNFLSWMEAGYPEGQAPVGQTNLLKMSASRVTGRVRKSLTSMTAPELEKLKKAFTGIMNLGTLDLNGYFQNAAIHGLPLAFCQHHVPGFQPWHRVQMWAFENSLRSIEGCEDVTLPYWDFNELLPDWMYEAPFASYTLPVDIGTASGSTNPDYKAGYQTSRYDAETILENFRNEVLQPYADAQAEVWWDNFNGLLDGTPNLDFILGHDSGHDATGDTMGQQNLSAFDPIFWFYHCNLDRMWWAWQAKYNAQTVEGFMKTIKNQNSSSYLVFTNSALGKMNPWAQNLNRDDLTAEFTIDSATNFDVSYDDLDLNLPASKGKKSLFLGMARTFMANDEEVNVRISDLDRTKIPGTFKVYLLKDGEVLAKSVFFQPDEVEKCSNCMQVPKVHFDFRLPLASVKGGLLSARVEPNNKKMYGDTVPLSVLGNPKIEVSLVLDAI
ncbi:tyrosinase family protein [Pedobacter gandavensis]|uniref:tyrosinase family protein n=1 Tax=Pedobacter gandavensis TaxID=2679963 RepID=UPI00292DEBD4|nr:tyrosinase family protein [Pedobacter gandavensis]